LINTIEIATADVPDTLIPVICADRSAYAGAKLFDPNSWTGASKGIIQSCWTEYSVLHHCVGKILDICKQADRLCDNHIKSVQEQWNTKKFDLGKITIYGQHSDLHMTIEAFFSGTKSLLDLIVQLLASEMVVSGGVDGFHRAQGVYGGKVLNALTNNASNERKQMAEKAEELIYQHKAAWIAQVVVARDQLIHPKKGMHQLMFHLEFSEQGDQLICVKITPPQIDSLPIDQYAQTVLNYAQDFSSAFLALFREAVPNSAAERPVHSECR
jgi:hypothetical protein